jgi:hypothetical protein
MHAGFWWETRKDIKKLEVMAVDGRIILKKLLSGRGLEYGTTAEPCDYGKEPSGSTICGEFLD